MFLWNLLLAAVWALAGGDFSGTNFLLGFVLGYAALWLGRDVLGTSEYCIRIMRIVALFFYFLWELILANLRVAIDVVTPAYRMRPGIIAVPLDAKTDLEILLFANLLTLTPGSFSLGLSDDRRTLFVHSMFIDDIEEERKIIKSGFERRLLEVLR